MTATESDETYSVTYEQVWQAWHDTTEPWGGCADREAVERVMALILPAKCVMTHTEPFDFAQCTTHDTTFPLGETCKFDGREPWRVFADEADEQRRLKVRAEIEVEELRAELDIWKPKPPKCPMCGDTTVRHNSAHLKGGIRPGWTCATEGQA